jgi:type II secretory pathway pseudopilin PulG
MKTDRLTTQAGFTLVEAVVSLGLFVLATAAVAGLLVSQTRMETSNATTTTAITLAAQALEDLRALDYPNIPTSQTSTTKVGALTYTVTSKAVFDTPAANLATITVTVSWTEPLGAKSYTLNSIYTDVTR